MATTFDDHGGRLGAQLRTLHRHKRGWRPIPAPMEAERLIRKSPAGTVNSFGGARTKYRNALMVNIATGTFDVVDFLLKVPGIDLTLTAPNSLINVVHSIAQAPMTPEGLVICRKILETLVESGHSHLFSAKTKKGKTPIVTAALRSPCDTACLELLLEFVPRSSAAELYRKEGVAKKVMAVIDKVFGAWLFRGKPVELFLTSAVFMGWANDRPDTLAFGQPALDAPGKNKEPITLSSAAALAGAGAGAGAGAATSGESSTVSSTERVTREKLLSSAEEVDPQMKAVLSVIQDWRLCRSRGFGLVQPYGRDVVLFL